MSKESILGLIRQVLTFAGVYLASTGILTGTIIEQIIAGIIAAIMIIWGWVDKSNRELSVWYSFSRHLLSVAGGLVLGFQWVSEDIWNNVVSITLGTVSIILSSVENSKKSQ